MTGDCVDPFQRDLDQQLGEIESLDLGAVQQTLLTPLCGRAMQFETDDPIVVDPLANRLVSRLPFDFRTLRTYHDTMVGTAIRAAVFDRWIRRELDKAPGATVVLIGEGLDTTFYRTDNDHATYFEIDLPDVIDLRKRFFASHPRRHLIAGSVLDGDWTDPVRRAAAESEEKNVVVQIAGVLMYLEPSDVRQLLVRIADELPGATVIFDTCSTLVVRHSQSWEPTARTTAAKYRFGIDDPRQILQWDPRLAVQEIIQEMDQYRNRWSFKTRFWSRVWPSLRRSYPLSRARFGSD